MKIPFDPRRRRAVVNPDGTMSIVEHLYELRTRMLLALLAITVTSVIGFFWYTNPMFGLPSTGEILRGPYCEVPSQYRANLGSEDCRLLATGAFDQIALRLKVAITVGVILAAPFWLYQLWAFIVPALHRSEKRYAVGFVAVGATLFIAGSALAYFLVAHAFEFLLKIGSDVQITALQGDQYFSFVLNALIIFGVSFEMPLLIVMLNLVGILPYAKLKKWRRGLLMSMFIFAAVITPAQDPLSMLALGAALAVLLELSIQWCRFHDNLKSRKQKNTDGWDGDIDDESASPTPAAPQPIGASGAPSASGTVGASAIAAPEKLMQTSIPRSGLDDVL
ncbi:twin-arginine translocase subunit TatC [Tsukamurella strandjordii]|uniref:Sec-independent protein translocase protein TatC n=1 Tax=Tsukamurella strandjordii TaxID=147577 RepID=A0AA90SPZ4_9ACTN|nr:twin-arginine translocase subunit TatC [Tsukamurella strandjordii]MDP0397356.1 twin-arginine translocase subunit TatC [Tsukamurella strandjordii]